MIGLLTGRTPYIALAIALACASLFVFHKWEVRKAYKAGGAEERLAWEKKNAELRAELAGQKQEAKAALAELRFKFSESNRQRDETIRVQREELSSLLAQIGKEKESANEGNLFNPYTVVVDPRIMRQINKGRIRNPGG